MNVKQKTFQIEEKNILEEDKEMSNEEYWMIHEMGETVLGSDEHLCRNMRYEKDKVLKYQLAVSRNLITRAYISLMEILDEKQKRGRLIVGGRVSE